MTQSRGGTDTLPDESEFRKRVSAFLKKNGRPLQPGKANGDQRPQRGRASDDEVVAAAKAWQRALCDANLAGILWPKQYGGQELPVRYEAIYREELAHYETSASNVFSVGFGMCMPTLLACGTEEQKARFVPPAVRADELWCLFLSEPGAGSDLAGLQTRAVKDGDIWRVNGQKVWTTGAQHCDFGLLLARTDPDMPKHRGLTMFILDLHTPGVTVRPLHQMNDDSEFNEVFFDDVEIPVDRVVGEVGQGWRTAITTLMHERMFVATNGTLPGRTTAKESLFEPIMTHVAQARARGLTTDPRVRQELANLYINTCAVNCLALRVEEVESRAPEPGPEGSMVKLAKAQLRVEDSHLAVELGGLSALAWEEADEPRATQLSYAALSAHSLSLGGGTNNVQRNIIGERILGLPKEPEVGKGLPFRELTVGTQR
jgi:alkylation response protein AidB-like acyl-CoA dehydrogenase